MASLLAGLVALSLAAGPAKPPAKAKESPKVKTFRFGGLDVQGEAGKPRSLYFLDRGKAEAGSARAEKRSFIPELKASRSAEEL